MERGKGGEVVEWRRGSGMRMKSIDSEVY